MIDAVSPSAHPRETSAAQFDFSPCQQRTNAKIPDDTQCEEKIERSRVVVV